MDTKTFPEPARLDLGELPGHSPAMLALKAAITRLAREPAPVWIHGETGTGKERVARLLHRLSSRADRPFVALHASTVTSGQFADGQAGGTVFIDALEELPAEAQAALLRRLQVDAKAPRVFAASQWDDAQLVAAGRLRPDLANRLGALRLAVPPLRERREDLPGLVSVLLAELGPDREWRLTDAAATAVVLHGWPGNVRELRNRLAQAVLLADDGTLTPDMLDLAAPGRPNSLSLRDMRQAAEREAITRALRQSQGQVPAAATMLGISRAQLYRLISRLKLDHHAVAEAMHVPPRPSPTTPPRAAPDSSDPTRSAMS